MKFLIAGGTGLIGSNTIDLILEHGHQINVLSRKSRKSNTPNLKYFTWDPSRNLIDESCINNVDTIINLTGSSVFTFWLPHIKNRILNSRINSLSILYSLLKKNKNHNIKQLISASAIGIYPNNNNTVYDEDVQFESHTFLASVVKEWEFKANEFKNLNIKVSIIRIGLVLSEKGGFLEKLISINKFKISTLIDSGSQWQSWIHINDLSSIIYYLSLNKIEGTFNAVSPNPVKFKELQNFVNNRFNKPLIKFNVPKILFITAFSILRIKDFYYDIIASNKNVSSKKIQDFGYKFIFNKLKNIK